MYMYVHVGTYVQVPRTRPPAILVLWRNYSILVLVWSFWRERLSVSPAFLFLLAGARTRYKQVQGTSYEVHRMSLYEGEVHGTYKYENYVHRYLYTVPIPAQVLPIIFELYKSF